MSRLSVASVRLLEVPLTDAAMAKPEASVSTSKPSTLLKFPDELLVRIAEFLNGAERQKSLHVLALVHRRFTAIVGEELYSTPSLKPRYARQIAYRLLDEPRLANKVTDLKIYGLCSSEFKLGYRVWNNDDDELQQILERGPPILEHDTANKQRWIVANELGDPFAFIAIILAVTPQLRHLKLPCQFAKALARCGSPDVSGNVSRPFLNHFLDDVSKNLLRLTIATTPQFTSSFYPLWHLSTVDLRPLTSVTHIDVPFSFLSTGSLGSPSTQLKLPPNLEKFRIYHCKYRIVRFLEYFVRHERHENPFLTEIITAWDEQNMGHLSEKLRISAGTGFLILHRIAKQAGVKMRWMFQRGEEDFPELDRNSELERERISLTRFAIDQ